MELTQEIANRYVGGQLEVQSKRYIYRGEIATIEVAGEHAAARLTVTFKWFAQLRECFGWMVSEIDSHTVSLQVYLADIGDGRIFLRSYITGETMVLFPPDGSKLDPAVVQDLVIQS